ncbi:hypothetical protein [Candidatus Electronema sp. JM]|uniref:hypothetical protein n=1 Tax=Candidatus Electronema sp. JM TaxID=3401571 RepID=UPI003AA9195B
MRYYKVEFMTQKCFCDNHWRNIYWSEQRPRQFCVDMFRRFFGGRNPVMSYSGHGIAEAWDRRGNCIYVEQIDRYGHAYSGAIWRGEDAPKTVEECWKKTNERPPKTLV